MNLRSFIFLLMAVNILRPQSGPQEQFLASPADIVIYGGAAGGGKSYGLLLEGARHKDDPHFNGIIFRRVGKQIFSGGGLWDTASNIYPLLGAEPKQSKSNFFRFPSKARVEFTHMEHEKNRFDHQGPQYPFIGFDELTHFTEKQFWYLFSRNRPASGCSVRPYMRCTTNPTHRDDPVGGWVRILIDWWIGKDGFPIESRSGVIRYFTRLDDKIVWVDKDWRDKKGKPPKSITFIPAKLDDNKILMEQDPTYETTLNSLSRVDRMRLLFGNWDVSEKGGMFERDWFKIVDEAPQGINWLRYWDRAATEPTPKNPDPDWTAGALCGIHNGILYIRDMKHFQESSGENEIRIKDTADIDGYSIPIGLEQEPGSAGVDVIYNYQTRVLSGYTVLPDKPTGEKIDRAKPWCAWAEFGNVCLVRGKWNEDFIKEAINFPNGKKDQVDAVSGAYKYLTRTFTYKTMKGRV